MKWFRIENKASDRAEIWIYDQIGEDWWTGDGVTAKSFQKELSSVKASNIDLHINSPGGSVFDGITIYNLIKDHPSTVTTYIDGMAASIASVIALAGDRVVMAENALFMLHNPSGMTIGTAETMRKTADVLDKIAGTMVGTYVSRSTTNEDQIKAWMEAETWMDSTEAKEAGFVHEISGEMDLAACSRFVPAMVKMGYRHGPEKIMAMKESPSKRAVERILRDAGCSTKLAKAIVSEGYPDAQRDVEAQDEPKIIRDRVSELLTRAEIISPTRR